MNAVFWHIGRSWGGPGPLEASCPCPKEPCGLVDASRALEECPQHHWRHAPAVRSRHAAEVCPGSRCNCGATACESELCDCDSYGCPEHP